MALTTDWVGRTLDDRYRVTAVLGEGGMGCAYRARDLRLGCDVVVKVPRVEMLTEPGFRERFQAEVGALVQFAHPHVVKVTDCNQHEGVPFAVMQYLAKGSLEDRRPKDAEGWPRPVAPSALTGWLLPVAEALDFVHKKGYVHRDVKPANILFDADKNAYVSDFGVAKVVTAGRDARQGLTGAGLVLGTPAYMAPELINGEAFDGRIDQYALAVMVYELLAGQQPLTGPTVEAVLVKQVVETPRPLAVVRSSIPQALSDAVAKALAKDPAQRFPSCAAFARAVLAAVGTATPKAPAPAVAAETAPLPSATTVHAANPVPFAQPVLAAAASNPIINAASPLVTGATRGPQDRPRRTALVLGSGTAVAIIAAIGWSFFVPRSPPPPREPTPPKPPPVVTPTVTALAGNPSPLALLVGGPEQELTAKVVRTRDDPVEIEIERVPDGIQVEPKKQVAAPGQNTVRFNLKAVPPARAVKTDIPVIARVVGTDLPFHGNLAIDVRLPDFEPKPASSDPVVLRRGEKETVKVRIDRAKGYQGPLTLTLARTGMLEGEAVRVGANATEADLVVAVKPAARIGQHKVEVLASADGSGAEPAHSLSFTVQIKGGVQRFEGHAGPVTCLAVSNNGRLALSGAEDGTVRLWDWSTGQLLWSTKHHQAAVRCAVFAPNDGLALTGGDDKVACLIDVTQDGRLTQKLANQHPDPIWAVAFPPPGTPIPSGKLKQLPELTPLTNSTKKLVFWDIKTGRPLEYDWKIDAVTRSRTDVERLTGDGQPPGPGAVVLQSNATYALLGLDSDTLRVRGVATQTAPPPPPPPQRKGRKGKAATGQIH